MSKIVTIVGARPQFIKAAMVSRVLREKVEEVLIHTGQHYDHNMSQLFFDEMNIPIPEYNLGISGGSHAEMTGKMMISIESILQKEKPDGVLVYGDTNSTLAGALAAAKLYIPVFHVEAGTRTHCDTNPEEINRICTDHISKKLYACTEENMMELCKEGLADRSLLTGDLMYDAFVEYSEYQSVENIEFLSLYGGKVKIDSDYYYLTCHREENTHDDANLLGILRTLNELDAITIYPVHPRNKERAIKLCQTNSLNRIALIEPVGYLESLALVKGCHAVVTDSGGLQREAFFAKKKCVTVLDFPVWTETMIGERNSLVHPVKDEIVAALNKVQIIDDDYLPFGNGDAKSIIVNSILNSFN